MKKYFLIFFILVCITTYIFVSRQDKTNIFDESKLQKTIIKSKTTKQELASQLGKANIQIQTSKYPEYLRSNENSYLGIVFIPGISAIHQIIESSPAHKAGMQVGDIILSMNGRLVKTDQDILSLLKKISSEETINLLIKRVQKELNIKIQLTKNPLIKTKEIWIYAKAPAIKDAKLDVRSTSSVITKYGSTIPGYKSLTFFINENDVITDYSLIKIPLEKE